MHLRVIGAGLPRTGTFSLKQALEHLLGGPCCHMSAIPGQPFNLGRGWERAGTGAEPDWPALLESYIAAVDWPVSFSWRQLQTMDPQALVVLSVHDSAEAWWQSMDKTILRQALAPDWNRGRDLIVLLDRFTGARRWDVPAVLQAAYERHNAAVRETVPRDRLLEWRSTDGWAPRCRALGVPVPDMPFPFVNRSADWPERF